MAFIQNIRPYPHERVQRPHNQVFDMAIPVPWPKPHLKTWGVSWRGEFPRQDLGFWRNWRDSVLRTGFTFLTLYSSISAVIIGKDSVLLCLQTQVAQSTKYWGANNWDVVLLYYTSIIGDLKRIKDKKMNSSLPNVPIIVALTVFLIFLWHVLWVLFLLWYIAEVYWSVLRKLCLRGENNCSKWKMRPHTVYWIWGHLYFG